jgi:hypothetical protein
MNEFGELIGKKVSIVNEEPKKPKLKKSKATV